MNCSGGELCRRCGRACVLTIQGLCYDCAAPETTLTPGVHVEIRNVAEVSEARGGPSTVVQWDYTKRG